MIVSLWNRSKRKTNRRRHHSARQRQAKAAARRCHRRRPRQAARRWQTRRSLAVAKGDEVLYGKYAGNDVKLGTKEVKILRESDILAKIVK